MAGCPVIYHNGAQGCSFPLNTNSSGDTSDDTRADLNTNYLFLKAPFFSSFLFHVLITYQRD